MIATSSILLIGAVLATVGGCAWLAVAMDAHWRQVRGGEPARPGTPVVHRVLGTAALAASAVLCFLADRPSMAALVWILLFAAGAATVAFVLAWRPTLLRVLVLGRASPNRRQ